jgi:hypothetical protein
MGIDGSYSNLLKNIFASSFVEVLCMNLGLHLKSSNQPILIIAMGLPVYTYC